MRAGNSATTETIDAVGPERPAFIDLVRTIKDAVGSRSQIVRVPGALIPPAARLLGLALRDTLLTADEYQGMADGLADTDGPATGETALSRGSSTTRTPWAAVTPTSSPATSADQRQS